MSLHPNLTQRPEHVDPDWWARIPWSTRRRIIDHHNRNNRPPESDGTHTPEPDITPGATMSRHERAAAVELRIEAGWTCEQIVEEMGVKPGTIVRALERVGRRDLIAGFDRLRKFERRAA